MNKWTIGGIAALLAAITVILTFIEDYRPWAKPIEVKANYQRIILVADDNYAFSIRILNEKISSLQLFIDQCRLKGDCTQETMLSFIQQQEAAKAEIERLKAQRKKVK
jgi:hypothetical protein